jgi:hypothetical protein
MGFLERLESYLDLDLIDIDMQEDIDKDQF